MFNKKQCFRGIVYKILRGILIEWIYEMTVYRKYMSLETIYIWWSMLLKYRSCPAK